MFLTLVDDPSIPSLSLVRQEEAKTKTTSKKLWIGFLAGGVAGIVLLAFAGGYVHNNGTITAIMSSNVLILTDTRNQYAEFHFLRAGDSVTRTGIVVTPNPNLICWTLTMAPFHVYHAIIVLDLWIQPYLGMLHGLYSMDPADSRVMLDSNMDHSRPTKSNSLEAILVLVELVPSVVVREKISFPLPPQRVARRPVDPKYINLICISVTRIFRRVESNLVEYSVVRL